jgi:hypothetical protein
MRVLVVLLCLLPQCALASAISIKLFGHDVRIAPAKPDDQDALFIDGKRVLTNQIIRLDEVGRIGSTSFAIGNSSAGGNACDGSPFVVRFAENEPVRLDGPLASCWQVKQKIERDRIVFEVPASPTGDGQRWIWTAAGLGPVETLKFEMADKGWDALRRGSIHHLSGLLGYSDLARQLKATVSDARVADMKRLMSGPDQVRYDGDMFFGEAVRHTPAAAIRTSSSPSISPRRIVVALKDSDKPPLIVPAAADWPPAPKAELGKWRRQWSK